MIIDCLRKRYLGQLFMEAECPALPVDCGPCGTVYQLSCKQQLHEARTALNNLITGQGEQEISENGRTVRYFMSVQHLRCLKDRIAELEMECGNSQSAQVAGCKNGCPSLVNTFARTRPPPMRINYRRWYNR